MILPDRMFCAEWIRDARLRRLPAHVQLLLIFLRPLCDRHGRFEFNPALIHLALYVAANCGNVSVRDVEAWLEILRSGGFIKAYTGTDGRRVGEIAKEYWRQKLSYGRAHYEAPGDQDQLALAAGDSPPPKKSKAKKPGGGGPPLTSLHFTSEAPEPSALRPPPSAESEAEWLARLAREWPEVDLGAELDEARRKKGRRLERRWFEQHWLPGCSEKVGGSGPDGRASSLNEPPAPEEVWREAAKLVAHATADDELRERRLTAAQESPWAAFGPEFRALILAEIKRRTRTAA